MPVEGSYLSHFFEGQPGVTYYKNGLPQDMSAHAGAAYPGQQVGSSMNMTTGSPMSATTGAPMQAPVPQFGGMAGWFQHLGKMWGGQQSPPQFAAQGAPSGFQMPNQAQAPFGNQLFGRQPTNQNFLTGGRY